MDKNIDMSKIRTIIIVSNECAFNSYAMHYVDYMTDDEKQDAYDFYTQISDKFKHTAEFQIKVFCKNVPIDPSLKKTSICIGDVSLSHTEIFYPLHLSEFITHFNVLPNRVRKIFDMNESILKRFVTNKPFILRQATEQATEQVVEGSE